MLEFKLDDRWTAEEALQHPWLQCNFAEEAMCETLSRDVFSNLVSFKVFDQIWKIVILKAERKLASAVWLYLVNYLTTQEEKN